MTQREYFEKDYYAVLGLSRGATAQDISKAYRKLARELHPDVRPDDRAAEARFKEVSEAYAVLSNPEKRQEYDRVREMVGSGFGRFAGPGGFPGAGRPSGAGAQSFDLGDLLGGLFGQTGGASETFGARRRTATAGGTAGSRTRRGRDAETSVTLSFEDAMAGVVTTLQVEGRARCTTCAGSGAAPGTAPAPCPMCNGAGLITSDQGMFSFSEPCPACGGRGVRIEKPCGACGGEGVQTRTRQVRARIPAGVRDGARIKLKGKGEAGTQGGPAGDLYVNVRVEPHALFDRRGDHLAIRVPITFSEAALGTRLKVPTLEEPVTVKVPPGTQSGRTFRVRGRGGPAARGDRGDLLVTVDVVVPAKLNREQRKRLQEYAATEDQSVRAYLDQALRIPAEE